MVDVFVALLSMWCLTPDAAIVVMESTRWVGHQCAQRTQYILQYPVTNTRLTQFEHKLTLKSRKMQKIPSIIIPEELKLCSRYLFVCLFELLRREARLTRKMNTKNLGNIDNSIATNVSNARFKFIILAKFGCIFCAAIDTEGDRMNKIMRAKNEAKYFCLWDLCGRVRRMRSIATHSYCSSKWKSINMPLLIETLVLRGKTNNAVD